MKSQLLSFDLVEGTLTSPTGTYSQSQVTELVTEIGNLRTTVKALLAALKLYNIVSD